MKNIKLLGSLLFLVTLFSCTKEIYVEIPDNDPKLVVNAYLAPENDSIQVWVSKSTPLYHIYDENNTMLSNAMVELSDDKSTWINIPYDFNTTSYLAPTNVLPILAQQKYYIRVSAPEFATVESEITIPEYSNINFRYFKLETRVGEYGDTSRLISYKFNDPVGVENFYAFKAQVFHFDSINQYSYYSELYNENGDWIMSDKVFDGKETTVTFTGYDVRPGDTVQITVMQTDESFYLFHYSLSNFEGQNPFSEATPIYSNISNGLGAFAGYTFRRFDFVIP